MGLLNVIKLANDYNKAKKLLKSNKAKVEQIQKYIDSLHNFIEWIKDFKVELDEWIEKAKQLMKDLSTKLKEIKKEEK
jgi:peptidoglycan hydrolase CwlO-like protein